MPPATEIARLQHTRSSRKDCPSGDYQPIRAVISGRDRERAEMWQNSAAVPHKCLVERK